MFNEPGFSGSTSANLLPGSTTAVSDAMAHSGSQSLQLDFQFFDAVDTRWIRLSSFNTHFQPNPRVRVREPGAPNPTISFYAKMEIVPEPATTALLGALAVLGARVSRRRTRSSQ